MSSKNYPLLLLGVFACSLSVIFLQNSITHPYWLCAARLLIAATFLSPLMFLEAKKKPGSLSPRMILMSFPGAAVLSIHFITWAMGARMTEAANGTLIVNLTTVVMPIVMFLMNGERVNRGEVIGTIITLVGVSLLFWSHYTFDVKKVNGDLVCFGSMCLFCIYLAFSRKLGMGRSIWLYIVPLYFMAGCICAIAAIFSKIPLPPATSHEITMLLCLGLVPTVIGHSIMNYCTKTMRGQVVSMANMLQFIFSGVTTYFLKGTLPEKLFYPVAAMILVGAVIVIQSHKTTEPDVDTES